MSKSVENMIKTDIQLFKLPRYSQLPDTGLFLEQVVQLVNGYLELLGGIELTSSMVSNYVKKKIISSPVKKLYGKEQIAYLIYIALAKTVASLEEIKWLIDLQHRYYSDEMAYDYFCDEFENVLRYIFECKNDLDEVGYTNSELKELLRNMIMSIAHKIHFVKYLEAIKASKYEEEK